MITTSHQNEVPKIRFILLSVQSLSRVRLFAIPWTVAHQAPLSVGFPREECRSGLPFSSPGDLPDSEIEPTSPTWQVGSPGGSVVKNPPASAGTVGSIPESGRSPGEENGNPLHYCCLENPMDRGT